MAYDLETLRLRRAARGRVLRLRRRAGALLVLLLALGGAAVFIAASLGGAQRVLRPASHVSVVGAAWPVPLGTAGAGRSHPDVQAQLAAIRRLVEVGLPVFCGGSTRRMVALTFDDGPGVYTQLAVNKLREHHLRATFFLVGKEVRAYPRLVRSEESVAAFGDHTMTHPFLPALASSAMAWQIAAARTLIEAATSRPVELFRPPYEGRTAAIDREVRALGMVEVLWNVDSRDSVGVTNYLQIERNVIAGLRPGSIILMHENHGQTIRALPAILAALARRGLRAVTVPELISADPPSVAQLRRGLAGCPVSLTSSNGS
jgi:peptidoglycan/xylan/chitin deacetylase (PgdA/CDA1 family)